MSAINEIKAKDGVDQETVDAVREVGGKYKYGWSTDIEMEYAPKGLTEDIVRLISAKNEEPEWMTEWRLEAYRRWVKMEEPDWAKLQIAPIDYQAISYYSAPKSKADGPKSLDEVDPELLAPLETGEADIVYGSRFLGRTERVHFRLHTFANRVLTWFSNRFTGYRLTDMETCYKVFPAAVARELRLRSRGFTIEPELTAAFAQQRLSIVEVPIRYENRGYEEGKKIGWKDGVAALWAIVRFRFAP